MGPIDIALIVVAAIAVLTIIGLLVARSAQNKLYFQLLGAFGQPRKRKYTYEEFETISHYFANTLKEDEFALDDITWNDLDLDSIFLMIDNTNSSVGRDYLYKLLRTPVTSEEELKKRDALIDYFNAHDFERTRIQMQYYNIGFSRKISVSDYMRNLFELKPQSNIFHYLVWVLYICSIVGMFYSVASLFLLILAIAIGVISYYKIKSRIDSYFECVRQLVAMVKTANNIKKLNIPELKEFNDYFAEVNKTFAKITRNSYLVVAQKQAAGSLMDIVMEYIKMITHIDLIKFNSMIKHFDKNYEAVEELMERLGYLESMISIAGFRRTLKYYCKPEFNRTKGLETNDLYHLLVQDNPVPNSVNEDMPMLITGSNASGKSTFLKSVAIGSILAQSIYTCPAASYDAPMYRMYSSMALTDSIESGESYYIVEIKSLKRIVDATRKAGKDGIKIMCFIDEVLRGTNTVERIAASSEILKNLADEGAMCFAATHDIELTHILEKYFANYHFNEKIEDNNIIFSYELQSGRATSRNAIKLLSIIGYDKNIIRNSEKRANDFMEKGAWDKA